jgi:hypothetical protein
MASGVAKCARGATKRAWAKWSQICISLMWSRIRIRIKSENQDPDPHLIEKLDPDPNPSKPANVQVYSQYHGSCPVVDVLACRGVGAL